MRETTREREGVDGDSADEVAGNELACEGESSCLLVCAGSDAHTRGDGGNEERRERGRDNSSKDTARGLCLNPEGGVSCEAILSSRCSDVHNRGCVCV